MMHAQNSFCLYKRTNHLHVLLFFYSFSKGVLDLEITFCRMQRKNIEIEHRVLITALVLDEL